MLVKSSGMIGEGGDCVAKRRAADVLSVLDDRGKHGLVNAVTTAGLESVADLRRAAVYDLLACTIAATDEDEEDGT